MMLSCRVDQPAGPNITSWFVMTVGKTHKTVYLVEPADYVGLPVGDSGIVRWKLGDIAVRVNPVCIVTVHKHV